MLSANDASLPSTGRGIVGPSKEHLALSPIAMSASLVCLSIKGHIIIDAMG